MSEREQDLEIFKKFLKKVLEEERLALQEPCQCDMCKISRENGWEMNSEQVMALDRLAKVIMAVGHDQGEVDSMDEKVLVLLRKGLKPTDLVDKIRLFVSMAITEENKH